MGSSRRENLKVGSTLERDEVCGRMESGMVSRREGEEKMFMGVVGKVYTYLWEKWKYSQGRSCEEKLGMRKKMEAGCV